MASNLQIFTLSDGTPYYTQQVTLSGTDYYLTLNWNDWGQYWTLDLALTDGTPIVSGRTVVLFTDLLGAVPLPSSPAHPRPPGPIFAYQLNGVKRRPSLNDLGVSHGLWYYDPL